MFILLVEVAEDEEAAPEVDPEPVVVEVPPVPVVLRCWSLDELPERC